MSYIALDITERIKKTKEVYMGLTVPLMTDPYHPTKHRGHGTGDRLMTLGYLRGWASHAKANSVLLRASYAEAQALYESKPMIYDHELLLGHLYLPDYTPEEWEEYAKLAEHYELSAHTFYERPPRKDHVTLDFEKLLRVGINGLRREIKENMDALDLTTAGIYPNMETLKKYEFYECLLIELDAVSDLARRYSEEALLLANEKPEPRKSELIRLSEILKKVPDEPAESFYEAIQSVQFFLSTLFGLYPLGRPDRYLYPYYEKDIASGAMTRELAQELVDNFCLYVSDRVFSRAACGFIVGGKDRDGNLVENDLTYMFITALDHLKLPDPNGALAVTNDTSDELLEYCATVLSHGTTHPAFYNDELISGSLVKHYGVDPKDAADYIHSTCAEITVIGKSKGHTCSFIMDLPRILVETVRLIGGFESFDELFEAYIKALTKNAREQSLNYAMRIMESARVGNEAMRSCALVDDCIARGKSFYEGGERYTFNQPILVGFGTVVDSLVAIAKLVYEEKTHTLAELDHIVADNYEYDERLRQYILNKLPHYGNDNKFADSMASRFAAALQKIFETKNAVMWEYMQPGTFSYINHALLGRDMVSTYDGRRAHVSYSDGCGAVQGRDVCGPTAMILSLTSYDQSKLLGGMVVNVKFGKSSLDGDKKKNLISMVRTFMERGGVEMQINAVDRKTLEDARENPEAHRDLIVRIGGYSDYFIRLAPVLQQEIIDRTEY